MAKNWIKLYKNYRGLWVALKSDEITVVASGKRLSDVISEAQSKGLKQPIVTKVPKENVTYIADY
jgi:hypothetical protein